MIISLTLNLVYQNQSCFHLKIYWLYVCHTLNVCVPKFYMVKPHQQCNGVWSRVFGRWFMYKDRSLMMGFMLLKKEARDSFLLSNEHTVKTWPSRKQEACLTRHRIICWHFNLGVASRTVRNQFVLFMRHPVYDVFL